MASGALRDDGRAHRHLDRYGSARACSRDEMQVAWRALAAREGLVPSPGDQARARPDEGPDLNVLLAVAHHEHLRRVDAPLGSNVEEEPAVGLHVFELPREDLRELVPPATPEKAEEGVDCFGRVAGDDPQVCPIIYNLLQKRLQARLELELRGCLGSVGECMRQPLPRMSWQRHATPVSQALRGDRAVLSASASISRMVSIAALMRGGLFHSSMTVNRSPSMISVLRCRRDAVLLVLLPFWRPPKTRPHPGRGSGRQTAHDRSDIIRTVAA